MITNCVRVKDGRDVCKDNVSKKVGFLLKSLIYLVSVHLPLPRPLRIILIILSLAFEMIDENI